MEQRVLGRTGRPVSVVGLGAWQLGGDWGRVDEEDALATLTAAVDADVTFVDTADVYGDGRSERLVGRSTTTASAPSSTTGGDPMTAETTRDVTRARHPLQRRAARRGHRTLDRVPGADGPRGYLGPALEERVGEAIGAEIDDRALHEVYLPHFRAAVDAEHRALAREVAARSTVLLRNEPVGGGPRPRCRHSCPSQPLGGCAAAGYLARSVVDRYGL